MVFHAHNGLEIAHIPDDIILSDLIFDPGYSRRPLSQSNKALFIDAVTGKAVDITMIKERTESLAKGLADDLGVQVGWNGVIGVFAPNNVFLFNPGLICLDRFPDCVLGSS